MAGDWIKMRIDLQSHPKVVRILSATKSDKFRVIGGLHAVWTVFDTHCEDGVLDGYTPETLDHIIGWDGFSVALITVGWLIENKGISLAMPEFSEHNGQSAKRRAEDQKRKRDSRIIPEVVRKVSANEQDKEWTREEKRREEVIPSMSEPSVPDCPHDALIDLYAKNLPELAQPRRSLWTAGKNAPALRQRWRWVLTECYETGSRAGTRMATTPQEALDWFDRFFGYVAGSDFLMGRSSDWSCDLAWLVTAKNFEKVIAGSYENKVKAA